MSEEYLIGEEKLDCADRILLIAGALIEDLPHEQRDDDRKRVECIQKATHLFFRAQCLVDNRKEIKTEVMRRFNVLKSRVTFALGRTMMTNQIKNGETQ